MWIYETDQPRSAVLTCLHQHHCLSHTASLQPRMLSGHTRLRSHQSPMALLGFRSNPFHLSDWRRRLCLFFRSRVPSKTSQSGESFFTICSAGPRSAPVTRMTGLFEGMLVICCVMTMDGWLESMCLVQRASTSALSPCPSLEHSIFAVTFGKYAADILQCSEYKRCPIVARQKLGRSATTKAACG